jgi:hypothetical protein
MTMFLKQKIKKCNQQMQFHKTQFELWQTKLQKYYQEQIMENPLLYQLLQQQQNQNQPQSQTIQKQEPPQSVTTPGSAIQTEPKKLSQSEKMKAVWEAKRKAKQEKEISKMDV